MTRIPLFLCVFALGCELPGVALVDEPSPTAPLTFPDVGAPAPLTVVALEVDQHASAFDLVIALSAPAGLVNITSKVDGVPQLLQGDAHGTTELVIPVAVDACATFGRDVVFTAEVSGSDEITAIMVGVAGHVAESGRSLSGLGVFCGSSEVVFDLDADADVWLSSDGPIQLFDRSDDRAVAGGDELALTLSAGRYRLNTGGSFVVVDAE